MCKETALVMVVGASLALSLPAHTQPTGQTQAQPPEVVRLAIVPPDAQPLRITADRDLAISPDGTHIVYVVGAVGQTTQLMVRAIDSVDAAALPGIIGALSPFFSPDGRWIGFFTQREIRKVPVTGGPAITVCRTAGALRGASWGPDDVIVFATDAKDTGLFSVPSGGGEPKVLTTPDRAQNEQAHWAPSVLPGGKGVLFTIQAIGLLDTLHIVAVLDLTTGQYKKLVRGGSQAEYVETGHLVFATSGMLRAVRFDLAGLAVLSNSVPVVEHVMAKKGGPANFTVSRQGALVYVPGGAGSPSFKPNSLVWVDRQSGIEEPIKVPTQTYDTPRLSPDGTRAVVGVRTAQRGPCDFGLSIWDFARKTLTPLSMPDIAWPVWTPDGRYIVYVSELGCMMQANLFRLAADGTGTAERLTTSSNQQNPQSISSDGKRLVVGEGSNLSLLSLDGPSTSRGAGQSRMEPLTGVRARNAEISPDGRWIAYESNESGRREVHVRPFPNVDDGHWQISPAGGSEPAWARNGRELFYLDANGLLTTVAVQTTPTFKASSPTQVLHARYVSNGESDGSKRDYDVSLDGQRFLMIKDPPATMVVVPNWFEELKRRMPRVADRGSDQAQPDDIEQMMTRFLVPFTNRDLTAFMAFFADDATMFFPFQDPATRVQGSAAIAQAFKDSWERAGPLRGTVTTIRPQDLLIQRFDGFAVATFHLGTDLARSRRTFVLRRVGSDWKIVHVHASTLTRTSGQ